MSSSYCRSTIAWCFNYYVYCCYGDNDVIFLQLLFMRYARTGLGFNGTVGSPWMKGYNYYYGQVIRSCTQIVGAMPR